jgi:hypothetical protein
MKLSRSSKAQSSATMPDWKPEIRRRLANLQLPPTREAAIVEELAQHLDESYAELLVSFRRVVLVRRESRLYVCFGL